VETGTNVTQRLNRLRAIIDKEAKQKAEKIMQDGRTSIGEIKNDLEKQRKFLQENRLVEINEGLEHDITDVKSELSRDSSSAALQFKQDMLDKLIKQVVSSFQQKMTENSDFYYKTYLTKLINETLDIVTFKEYFLMVNGRDKAYIKKNPDFLKNFGKKLNLKEETFSDDDIGCIIEDKQGNVKIDQRLSKKIESNDRFLKTKLSPLLFEGA
jgi:vacuolar-type H+-ATPase subunit E/Vma4